VSNVGHAQHETTFLYTKAKPQVSEFEKL